MPFYKFYHLHVDTTSIETVKPGICKLTEFKLNSKIFTQPTHPVGKRVGLQSIFSEALRQVKNQGFKVIFWNWGPTTIWHDIEYVAFFSQYFSTLLNIDITFVMIYKKKCNHIL